jgi:hypothetical protein
MSLQTIVNNATYIDFKQAKLAGQSISRSGRILTSEVVSAEPFRMDVGMHEGLTYSTNRGLAQSINNLDITVEEAINIGSSNSGLAYITRYMGGMDAAQVAQVTVTSASAGNIILNTTSVTGTTPVNAFVQGDIITLDGAYRYPYIVTADVSWSASSITVPIHRNFIPQDSYTTAGAGIEVGVDCTWSVKMVTKPNYSVLPGDRLVFNSSRFDLVEIIRKEDG